MNLLVPNWGVENFRGKDQEKEMNAKLKSLLGGSMGHIDFQMRNKDFHQSHKLESNAKRGGKKNQKTCSNPNP